MDTSNTWLLLADDSAKPTRQTEDLVTEGTAYLQRVVAQHPNTPFAYVAEAELKRGFGWKWEETHRVYKEPKDNVIKPLFIYETDPETGKRRIIGKL